MSTRQDILIVDQDRTRAETLARVLQTRGYGTRVAASGREALDLLRRQETDLLLTDVGVPGAEGTRLFAEVREEWPELPVLVVAVDGSVDVAIDAVRRGAADFIQRPVRAGELVHRSARVLRERALRAENAELRRRLDAGRAVGPPARPGGDGDADRGLVDRLLASEITFEEFEREILVQALRETGGNQSRAARMLGMTRRTLQYRIEKFDIDTASMRA